VLCAVLEEFGVCGGGRGGADSEVGGEEGARGVEEVEEVALGGCEGVGGGHFGRGDGLIGGMLGLWH
jgi:hypothetical protein